MKRINILVKMSERKQQAFIVLVSTVVSFSYIFGKYLRNTKMPKGASFFDLIAARTVRSRKIRVHSFVHTRCSTYLKLFTFINRTRSF